MHTYQVWSFFTDGTRRKDIVECSDKKTAKLLALLKMGCNKNYVESQFVERTFPKPHFADPSQA